MAKLTQPMRSALISLYTKTMDPSQPKKFDAGDLNTTVAQMDGLVRRGYATRPQTLGVGFYGSRYQQYAITPNGSAEAKRITDAWKEQQR